MSPFTKAAWHDNDDNATLDLKILYISHKISF